MILYNKDIAQMLRYIREKPGKLTSGICYALRHELTYSGYYVNSDTLGQMLQDLWKDWGNFSGNPMYPVAIKDSCFGPCQQYSFCFGVEMYKGPYGSLRMELLDFMIEKLNKNPNEVFITGAR